MMDSRLLLFSFHITMSLTMITKRIWKYQLKLTTQLQQLEMPVRAEILTVQTQGIDIMIWAACDIGAEVESRVFAIVGTGSNIPELPMKHLGTVQLTRTNMREVWHIFEVLTRQLGPKAIGPIHISTPRSGTSSAETAEERIDRQIKGVERILKASQAHARYCKGLAAILEKESQAGLSDTSKELLMAVEALYGSIKL